jgi:hypothetical protein
MSEHASPVGQDHASDAPDDPDQAREAALMRQVQRMQRRHREGGMDPEPDDSDEDPAASEEG